MYYWMHSSMECTSEFNIGCTTEYIVYTKYFELYTEYALYVTCSANNLGIMYNTRIKEFFILPEDFM